MAKEGQSVQSTQTTQTAQAAQTITTIDGNEAAAYAAYAFTEVAAIYPITPSSPMAEKTDEWAAAGRKNVFGRPVDLVEMQSEAGAIGAVHGALEAGALGTSFTSSQGLMLMVPVLYRIAGTKQPCVLHVASRTVGTHAMSIFGDHSDVMACRATGFALLSSGSVQEAADLGFVAHLAAIKARIPFLHFFDGFRTSHEIQKISLVGYEEAAGLLDREALAAFRDAALNPDHPTLRNTVQNPDIYFQVRESNNKFYDALPGIVQEAMDGLAALSGRQYRLFEYYGDPAAEHVLVCMGSVSGTARDVVDWLNAQADGAARPKVGLVQVHLYRPFSAAHFLAALPKTARRIAVLDRVKELGAVGEPLYEDVCAVMSGRRDTAPTNGDGGRLADTPTNRDEDVGAAFCRPPLVVGGRYGLSSKDVGPEQIKAVFDNLAAASPKNGFTVGIDDDVTHLSLPLGARLDTESPGTVCCKFWGLGSDGTVGANKNSIKIIAESTDLYAQAYFEYDTKKSFGVTKSHLRFGTSPIRATHLIKRADFVAVHHPSYLGKYDIVSELKPGGTLLLNCPWKPEELGEKLPKEVKRLLRENGIRFYIIDANRIAAELGMRGRVNMVLQSAFFKLTDIIPYGQAVALMKDAAAKTYGRKGGKVVEMNHRAIDAGADGLVAVDVPEAWEASSSSSADRREVTRGSTNEDALPSFIKNILEPINAQKGDELPVSAFAGIEDGTMPMGTSAYEKRGIATGVPVWAPEKCLQCNLCAFVCPHAVIRPYLLDEKELAGAPKGWKSAPGKGASKDYAYSLAVSTLDCTGCGSCAAVCPAKEKALAMKRVAEKDFGPEARAKWAYALTLAEKPELFPISTVKGSQFRQPLLEFSGACAGCGETPYAKLLTQLFGDRMYWANATGCTQAWGASMPSIPYTVDRNGRGPAWSNSLFEDNAEFSLGMQLAVKHAREALREKALALKAAEPSLAGAVDAWLDTFMDTYASRPASDGLAEALEAFCGGGRPDAAPTPGESALPGGAACSRPHDAALDLAREILARRDQLAKKSVWMYGGDGWAYDIGYGGLDHVFSMGVDVNVLVVDTEVYSNTGAQSSKATPLGASVKFQASGKKTKKKDLGRQMMTYGNVYVAQVALGADPQQLVKTLLEADAFPGPSLVIAYAPCIEHGIKLGMDRAVEEMKRAVQAGYWHLYRYDPRKEKPFTLDSKAPTMPYEEFLDGEVRYASLKKTFPENAKRLFAEAAQDAAAKYALYKEMEGEE
ncbi:MAG: pyruvate:ferredoxin (flavodoxin) oxidoreductase [Clostridiales Family XIII bacterium]|jgi:pyruvate-ferredoxin/flavodoxin oxidoreductase|nr:pyruvate:ferredoxin (flavodoxin) oxidoreductase [Clostridiales Family XIII bacterium]